MRSPMASATAGLLTLSLLTLACTPVDVEGEWSGLWRIPLDATPTVPVSIASKPTKQRVRTPERIATVPSRHYEACP